VLPADFKIDEMELLLAETLDSGIPFMFWASGTMTEWEAEFYGKAMPAGKMNQRWWELVRDKQGVVPPVPRGEAACDAATKSHISDAPAYYYNYAIAQVLKHQFHDHICRKILKQNPHSANYSGNKEVGAWLHSWMSKGATEDWRKLLKDATGEDLSTRAMAEYYAPLLEWLRKQNAGRQKGW
jgi:peptidyl-dipeptidase A